MTLATIPKQGFKEVTRDTFEATQQINETASGSNCGPVYK